MYKHKQTCYVEFMFNVNFISITNECKESFRMPRGSFLYLFVY